MPGGSQHRGYTPAFEQVHRRPIMERPFGASSTYQEDQRRAQEARQGYFPYRDEFAPRSKRLLYEMALNACSQDGKRSDGGEDSVSCFTVTDSMVSSKSGASRARSGVSRASSVPSLPAAGPRLPTADSQRVPGGIAKRRKELLLRSPEQWEADRVWVAERWEQDGPAGLATANYIAAMYQPTLQKYGERIHQVHHMMGGRQETVSRKAA